MKIGTTFETSFDRFSAIVKNYLSESPEIIVVLDYQTMSLQREHLGCHLYPSRHPDLTAVYEKYNLYVICIFFGMLNHNNVFIHTVFHALSIQVIFDHVALRDAIERRNHNAVGCILGSKLIQSLLGLNCYRTNILFSFLHGNNRK